jgi:hypothetical protein
MLENQWHQGLGLRGFESPELERNDEKEGEELVGVPRRSLECGGGKSFVKCEEKPNYKVSSFLRSFSLHCHCLLFG